jgi:hypothetical protein
MTDAADREARARIQQVLDELDRLSFELHRQS